MRVCRYRALRLESRDGALRYVIDPVQCTGCGVCLDVCDVGAISLRDGGPAEVAAVALSERICPRCGAAWHAPIEQQEREAICSICRQKSTVGRLFQVRD